MINLNCNFVLNIPNASNCPSIGSFKSSTPPKADRRKKKTQKRGKKIVRQLVLLHLVQKRKLDLLFSVNNFT